MPKRATGKWEKTGRQISLFRRFRDDPENFGKPDCKSYEVRGFAEGIPQTYRCDITCVVGIGTDGDVENLGRFWDIN